MRVRFRLEAEGDVESAYDWYEGQRPSLGTEFRLSLERTVELIAERPEAFTEVAPPFRRALLRRFPYALYYRVNEDFLEVIACLHMRREPKSWRMRG